MSERPNMLLLLTDQERYDMTSPDGPSVRTPHMDELAADGVRFERAYTPIGICSSTRASLLTGLYPHSHGMLNNCHGRDAIIENLPTEFPTFSERLAEAGYTNSYAGKWHVGRDQVPEDFAFETVTATGPTTGMTDLAEYQEQATTPATGLEDYQRELDVDPADEELTETVYTSYEDDPLLVSAKTSLPKEATRTYYLAEQTIERLERYAETGEQFFHRLDFPGPHHPYVVPEPYASMYDPADIEPWPTFADTFEGKPGIHREHVDYRGVADFSWDDWAEAVSKYFGFVTFIDEQIGRVLDAVDRLGLADGTAVFKAADHGDFTGSHRQLNKGPLMYEEIYHVPLLVRWPGTTDPGRSIDAFVRLLDLMPTFCEIGGANVPDNIHGRSLVPLLEGTEPEQWPDSLFAEYHGEEFGLYSQRFVRKGDYKFIYNAPDVNELYDLAADPHELNNLVDHPEYDAVRAELETELLEWMAATDDPIETWTRKALGR